MTSHSVRYQHLRLDSTPALPLSVAPSPPLPPSLSRVSRPFLIPPCYSLFFTPSPVPVPTPSISVSSTVPTAGAPLTLICDYTLSLSLSVNTAASWMVNGSVPDTSQDGRISTDGDTLTFSPLTTSDTGNYTCTLALTAPHVQGHPVQSAVEDIAVQSNVWTIHSIM